jgi:hypothetical protein
MTEICLDELSVIEKGELLALLEERARQEAMQPPDDRPPLLSMLIRFRFDKEGVFDRDAYLAAVKTHRAAVDARYKAPVTLPLWAPIDEVIVAVTAAWREANARAEAEGLVEPDIRDFLWAAALRAGDGLEAPPERLRAVEATIPAHAGSRRTGLLNGWSSPFRRSGRSSVATGIGGAGIFPRAAQSALRTRFDCSPRGHVCPSHPRNVLGHPLHVLGSILTTRRGSHSASCVAIRRWLAYLT